MRRRPQRLPGGLVRLSGVLRSKCCPGSWLCAALSVAICRHRRRLLLCGIQRSGHTPQLPVVCLQQQPDPSTSSKL